MSSEGNITAFNQIFEQRLSRLLKQIKELRKHPGKKEQIKDCVREAKKLKKAINKAKKIVDTTNTMFISVKAKSADFILETSEQIDVTSVEEQNDIVTIRFKLK